MFNQKTYEAMIQLFNNEIVVLPNTRIAPSFNQTLPNGYVLVGVPYSTNLDSAIRTQKLTQENANNTFLKTWERAETISTSDRVLLQMVHYFTTYGLESFDIEVDPFTDGELDVSEFAKMFYGFTAITPEEAVEKILTISSVAMAEKTLENVMIVLDAIQPYTDLKVLLETSNNELLIRVCDRFQITPTSPDAWLRYVIYKVTGETLVIKNRYMIDNIRENWVSNIHDEYLKSAPKNLASIFLRNKPLFLAMKKGSRNKNFFNRLRRDAEKMHKPLSQPYYRTVTAAILGRTFDVKRLEQSLTSATIFDCVKLYNALAFRYDVNSGAPMVYRVRNGKSFVTKLEKLGNNSDYIMAMAFTLDAMKNKVPNMDGKIVYIPEYIEYGFPTSEKQFIGNLPNNTRISFKNPVAFGVHWSQYNVDIDLSCFNEGGRYGWNAGWRDRENSIVYSGDMTRATEPYGASEMFKYSGKNLSPMVLSANYFNYRDDKPEATLFLAPVEYFTKGAIDISKALFVSKFVLDRKETTAAIFEVKDGRFYTYLTMQQLSEQNVSSYSGKYGGLMEYTVASTKASLYLNGFLSEYMGATVVNVRPEDGVEYIDLSPENLDKSTLLNLLK